MFACFAAVLVNDKPSPQLCIEIAQPKCHLGRLFRDDLQNSWRAEIDLFQVDQPGHVRDRRPRMRASSVAADVSGPFRLRNFGRFCRRRSFSTLTGVLREGL